MLTQEFSNPEPTLPLFRAARFAYRVGSPIMTDAEYDVLERQIRQKFPEAEELYQLYENDKVNIQELAAFGIEAAVLEYYSKSREYKVSFKYPETESLLNEDNYSIVSMKTDEEVYTQFVDTGAGEYKLSPKIDGLYVFLVYERSEGGNSDAYTFVSAMTRGEEDSRIDVTNVMSNIIPTRIVVKGEGNALRIGGEAIFDAEGLKQTSYKTTRSACMGTLSSTVNVKSHYHQHIHYFAHGAVMSGEYSENLTKLKDAGFTIVPRYDFCFGNEPKQLFIENINPILEANKAWMEDNQIEIDGIVAVYTRDTSALTGTKGNKQYRRNTFAIKTGFWNKGFYVSTITEIEVEQQDSRVSYKLVVVPVTAYNGSTLTRVTDLNLSTLIKDDIRVGDQVAFKYMNSTTIKYLYKVV